MGLSGLGIFHTIIGIMAIVGAIVGFIRSGKVDLGTVSGKIYFYATIITAVTALGISKHGLNAGHAFSVFIIILVVAAYFLHSGKKGNNSARYWENFLFSLSFFLSLIPTINETFTRVPVVHPLAKDVKDPIIAQTLLFLFILFIAGCVYQFIKQKKINNKAASFYIEE